MGAGTDFVLGGLLQGLGQGITNITNQKREDALMKLRRQFQQEDDARKREQQLDDRAVDRAYQKEDAIAAVANRKELLKEAGQIKLVEIDAEAKADAAKERAEYDREIDKAIILSKLKINEDATSKKIAKALDTGEISTTKVGEDGSLVLIYKNGRREVDRSIKVQTGSGDDDSGGGSIAAARGARGGESAPPAPKANDQLGQAKVQLGKAYTEAATNPKKAAEYRQRYPQMFNADGSLKDRASLIAALEAKYGR